MYAKAMLIEAKNRPYHFPLLTGGFRDSERKVANIPDVSIVS